MKIYHICEYCDLVFNTTEVEGQEGAVELKGICDECSSELGFSEHSFSPKNFWYN
ncbi:MAG: hypothetical protein GX790_04180 [Syntrophomonadaceae bacterium]|nr:hypothetical protein [Syntrophomonadaceae bacterium]